jgi:hypothetical protein
MVPFPLGFATLGGRVMFFPLVAMVTFGFMLGSALETRREVISRYSSQKSRQADKKYLRACGGRAFVFLGFFGVRGDSRFCRTWLTLHRSETLATT